MDILYPVEMAVTLRPVWHTDPPEVNIGINGETETWAVTHTKTFEFEFAGIDSAELTVELVNKTDKDTVPHSGLDKAVVIESVSFFGIEDPRFVWQGIYRPKYPEPWYSQQDPLPSAELRYSTYLGWNGVWSLKFGIPVFTWMHHVQSLGTIYP